MESPIISWFVMRDLKRPNAKLPAYKFLAEQGLEVFTPMTWRLSVRHGKRIREERPFARSVHFFRTCCLSIATARCWIRWWSWSPPCSTVISVVPIALR